MARLSWAKPPPVVVVGGTENYLRDREVKNAVRVAASSGISIEYADTADEIHDALNLAETFGQPCLIITGPKAVDGPMLKTYQENPHKRTCILVVVPAALNEKKLPFLEEVHGAFTLEHTKPTTKKGLRELAVRFAQAESDRLLNEKKTLDLKLAKALVNATGIDLGVVAFEILKVTTLARSLKSSTVEVAHLRATIRPSADVDMGPLREALKRQDLVGVATALDKMRRAATSDPVMLLLRAPGGPADLATTWLRAALLIRKGASAGEIAARLSTPEWAVDRDIMPAAQRWQVSTLRTLVADLARVDRAVLKGAPAPWVSCESAILLGCSKLGSQ